MLHFLGTPVFVVVSDSMFVYHMLGMTFNIYCTKMMPGLHWIIRFVQ